RVVAHAFARRVLARPGPPLAVSVGTVAIDGDVARVDAALAQGGDRYALTAHLTRPGPAGAWKLVDLVNDGSSVVETYRRQFAALIAQGGVPRLRQALEARWATLAADTAPAPATASAPPGPRNQRRTRAPVDQGELVRAGGVLFGVGRGVLEAPTLLGGD
ncbi:MAG: ABC transporter substrate-binding protein, partial [Myxococcaceae bacterium]|nr:ABC transporter substrate-binding protein [Myxococcaceae bacterium]